MSFRFTANKQTTGALRIAVENPQRVQGTARARRGFGTKSLTRGTRVTPIVCLRF
jgi:hypothetical protein